MPKKEKQLHNKKKFASLAKVFHSKKKAEVFDIVGFESGFYEIQNRELFCIVKQERRFKRLTSPFTFPETAEIVQDEQKRKLDEAEQSVAKQNSKKKKLTNVIFFVVNLAVLAGILLYNLLGQEFKPLSGLQINGWAVLIIFVAFVLSLCCEVFAMGYLLKKSVGKWRLGLCFKMNTIGHYYDAVTPLATGGQPFQITYLKSHDVPLHSALAIPLAKYVFSQIVWVLVSFICMIVSFTDPTLNSFVSVVSVIGFVLSSFMLIITVFLSISKTVGRKLVVKVLKLLQKMKIVKDYDKQYEKISKYIEDFQSVMKQYATSFKDFVLLFGFLLLKLVLTYIMAFFIFCMFNGFEWPMFFKFFVMAIMIDLAASFFPLPGGTGMSEISFSAMFAAYFSGGVLFWALLLWRFMTYYIHLLIGISVLTYDFAFGNRKYRWLKRKEELSEESRIFKQEQINRFRAERNKRRRSQRI